MTSNGYRMTHAFDVLDVDGTYRTMTEFYVNTQSRFPIDIAERDQMADIRARELRSQYWNGAEANNGLPTVVIRTMASNG